MTQVVNVALQWYYLMQAENEFAKTATLLREFKPKCILKSLNSSLKTTYSKISIWISRYALNLHDTAVCDGFMPERDRRRYINW